MLDRLRKQNLETSTYLFLATANLAIGFYLIHTAPVDIAADAEQYYEAAKALVGKGGELSYDKDSWGYPILLILTGLPWTRWPVITQVVQVCMASAIPYFVGSSLRQLGAASWISVSAAILSFLTLPVVFATALLTDTDSEFLLYLVIWLIAWALMRTGAGATGTTTSSTTQWKIATAIAVVFFLLYLVRPANDLLAYIALGIGLATTAKAARGITLRAILVLAVLTLAWIPLQKGWTAWAEAKAGHSFQTEGGWAGILLFRNVYTAGATFVGHSTIRPENGRCSSLVYESVAKNIKTKGDAPYMKGHNGPPTTDEVFTIRDNLSFVIIWKSVEGDFGPKEMDRIFWCAAFEGLYAEPKALLYFYDGFVAFFLFDDLIYDYGYRQAWRSAGDYASINLPFWAWSMYAGAIIKVIALLIALVTLVPTWQRGGGPRAFAAMLWAMVLYLGAVHVVFSSETWRYITPVIPALVLLAGLGLDSLRSRQSALAPMPGQGAPAD